VPKAIAIAGAFTKKYPLGQLCRSGYANGPQLAAAYGVIFQTVPAAPPESPPVFVIP
jgi:hypothetical protein